jgi:glyoxylase-like metal-dependent hydrolase (beta-lactamase superfamily II)
VFDSGMSLAAQNDPEGYVQPLGRSWELEFGPGEDLAARLEALEVDPGEVNYLINSHLHFDHAGGNALLPNAPVVVQRLEWEHGKHMEPGQDAGYRPDEYDLGQDMILADGEHDLFGDGTVVCVPTYGHTPGHQSLRVRLAGGDVVLSGDACYLRQSLEELHLPGFPYDREAMIASLHTLRELQARGARIIYGHDPDYWATVPQAPAEVA